MSTPLHAIGDFFRELLSRVPLTTVRALFVAIPLVLLVWVLRLPKKTTTPEQPTGRFGENLKYGAALALVLQILIYALI